LTLDLKIEVLEYLKTIPKSKVTTYKNIALKFWIHPRAVASIMRWNKFPEIYPCYKVISSSWKISWYNTERWVEEKVEKLKCDWIEIINWKIDKKFVI